MATKIILQEDEYGDLQEKIKTIHEDVLEMLQSTVEEITSINQAGGGFKVDKCTEKIKAITDEIDVIRTTMETVFSAEDTIITAYVNSMDDLDTLC